MFKLLKCGEAAEDGLSARTPANHVENKDEIPGSWFWLGLNLAVVAVWAQTSE